MLQVRNSILIAVSIRIPRLLGKDIDDRGADLVVTTKADDSVFVSMLCKHDAKN